MHSKATTRFIQRGRLAGLVRDGAPTAVTGDSRASLAARQDTGQPPVDEALYYRARLILGDIPRPGR
jgi:hypothetical protein